MPTSDNVFNFPPLGTPISHDRTNSLRLDDSPQHADTPSFGSNPQHTLNSAFSPPSAPFLDTLLIDNLAKDFGLEEIQRANLHAFVQVISVLLAAFALTHICSLQRSARQMDYWASLTY
jgi:hypothetical protein